ncbi:MAG: hypothetical protein FWC41_05075 [Firmicutes bacterium]|nr:hypothetical protein [Bacillota bacterium]
MKNQSLKLEYIENGRLLHVEMRELNGGVTTTTPYCTPGAYFECHKDKCVEYARVNK